MNKVVIADIKAVKALEKRVISPGLGYSVITVGGFEDNNTATWSDDKMWANSAYVDLNRKMATEKNQRLQQRLPCSCRHIIISKTGLRW